ncbi:hypothetical protein ACHAW6_009273 [Cyclotella cf. meneghiniana]
MTKSPKKLSPALTTSPMLPSKRTVQLKNWSTPINNSPKPSTTYRRKIQKFFCFWKNMLALRQQRQLERFIQ